MGRRGIAAPSSVGTRVNTFFESEFELPIHYGKHFAKEVLSSEGSKWLNQKGTLS